MARRGISSIRTGLAASVVGLTATGWATPLDALLGFGPANGSSVATSRLLVKPRATSFAANALASRAAVGKVEPIGGSGVEVWDAGTPGRAMRLAESLAREPSIEFVEVERAYPPATAVNDPLYGQQWHLARIGAPVAWSLTLGAPTSVIAVLDTGVDAGHPDLRGRLVPGWNAFDRNGNWADVNGHGTSVAGVLGAATHNQVGIAGVGRRCMVMPVRVSDLRGWATTSSLVRGLDWAGARGARVANISYPAGLSRSVSDAARRFMARGGVVIVAAGNDGQTVLSPDDPNVVVVSATDREDRLAGFSTRGTHIDVSAPGVEVLTLARGGGYVTSGGTSLAAPVVAGVAGLMISVNPNLSGPRLRDLLKRGVSDLGARGRDSSFGTGRIHAGSAVAWARHSRGSGP